MANVSLREYYREIELLVGQGRLDEVIVHCRHILKFFPKDVAIYRLLGKAYLESRRFSDATDILQRVLSVVPDDFVSHVGMSLIREDEGNLDASIWHMERGFEVQPSNSAIRDELRRLFGKRDGMEPPKIRLTRGALARMYANGNLYQQSISELRAALSEEPQRFDLLVLLARMYYLNGQRVDAAEVCNSLLGKLPFCMDANRILAAVLQGNDRGSEAEVYMQRLQVLDPYSAFAPPGSLDSDGAADSSVTLPRLEWEAGQEIPGTDSHPSWASSLGIALEDESSNDEELPAWLTEEGSEQAGEAEFTSEAPWSIDQEQEEFESAEDELALETNMVSGTPQMEDGGSNDNVHEAEDLIPDWMKDSGWATATGEADEGVKNLTEEAISESQPTPADAEMAGELPPWLQDIAPADSGDESEEIDLAEENMSGEIPAWLSSQPPGHTDSVVMWLNNQADQEGLPKTGPLPSLDPESGEEIPDWLQSVVAGMSAAGAAEALDQDEPEIATDSVVFPAKSNQEDWIDQAEADAPINPLEDTRPRGTAPLVGPTAAGHEPSADLETETPDEVEELAADVGLASGIDWSMKEPEMESDAAEGFELASEDELPDWLVDSGSGEHELSLEEHVAEEMSEDGNLPSWLLDMEKEAEAFHPPDTEQVSPVIDEEAERSPDAQFDFMEAEAESEIEAEGVQTPDMTAFDDTPPWILEAQADVDEILVLDEDGGKESDEMTSEEFESMTSTLPSEDDQDAALAWLESLALKQGVNEEELVTDAEDRLESPPEWVLETAESDDLFTTDAEDTESFTGELSDKPAEEIADAEEDFTPVDEQPSWAAETMESLPKVSDIPDWAMDTMTSAAEEDKEQLKDNSGEPGSEPGDRSPDWDDEKVVKPVGEADWMRETRIPEAELVEDYSSEGPAEAEFESMEEAAETSLSDEKVGMEASESEATEPTSDWMVETALPGLVAVDEILDRPDASLENEPLPDTLRSVEAEGETAEWMLETEALQETEVGEISSETETEEEVEEIYWKQDTDTPEPQMDGADEPSIIPESEWMVETALPDTNTLEPVADQVSEISFDASEAQAEVSIPEPQEARKPAPEEAEFRIALDQAKSAIQNGEIGSALAGYKKLIRRRHFLDQVIQDLEEATYRYPVDTKILETLGDAYSRSDRLQDALNSYGKAEELLH